MMEITAEIRALIDKAAAGVELAGDEYIDPADGLIHCKRCGGQRPFPQRHGTQKAMRSISTRLKDVLM